MAQNDWNFGLKQKKREEDKEEKRKKTVGMGEVKLLWGGGVEVKHRVGVGAEAREHW